MGWEMSLLDLLMLTRFNAHFKVSFGIQVLKLTKYLGISFKLNCNLSGAIQQSSKYPLATAEVSPVEQNHHKICWATRHVMKVGLNVAQCYTIHSIWRNSRINTRRMSLAITDASTQRVLWKLWHDNQATPIIFQIQSHNATALRYRVSYKACGGSNNNDIQVLPLYWHNQLLCVCMFDQESSGWSRCVSIYKVFSEYCNCETNGQKLLNMHLMPSNECLRVYLFSINVPWNWHLFSWEWLPDRVKCSH